MKKVAIVINDLGSYLNFIHDFVKHFINSTNDVEIHVICSKNIVIKSSNLLENDAKIKFEFVEIPRSFKFKKILKSANQIRKIIRRYNITLVYSHFTSSIFCSILFKVEGVVYVGMFHGLNFPVEKRIKYLASIIIEKFSMLRLERVYVLNNFDYQVAIKSYPTKIKKLNSAGLGCDLEKYKPLSYKGLQAKSPIVLGFCGRFVKFKGFDLLIRIFFQISEKFPNKFKLLLIGDFDVERNSGLNAKERKKLIESADIKITGFVSDVNNYLELIDIFIFLSKKEGMPVALMEALAMSKIIIALNTRGASDLIIHGKNGFLIEYNKKSEVIINQVIKLINEIINGQYDLEKIYKFLVLDRFKYSRNIFNKEQANELDYLLNK